MSSPPRHQCLSLTRTWVIDREAALEQTGNKTLAETVKQLPAVGRNHHHRRRCRCRGIRRRRRWRPGPIAPEGPSLPSPPPPSVLLLRREGAGRALLVRRRDALRDPGLERTRRERGRRRSAAGGREARRTARAHGRPHRGDGAAEGGRRVARAGALAGPDAPDDEPRLRAGEGVLDLDVVVPVEVPRVALVVDAVDADEVLVGVAVGDPRDVLAVEVEVGADVLQVLVAPPEVLEGDVGDVGVVRALELELEDACVVDAAVLAVGRVDGRLEVNVAATPSRRRCVDK